jgi:hypothetical protein
LITGKRVVISNNIIRNMTGSHGIEANENLEDSIISDNIIDAVGGNAIYLNSIGTTGSPSKNNIIKGNQINTANLGMYFLECESGIIENNLIRNITNDGIRFDNVDFAGTIRNNGFDTCSYGVSLNASMASDIYFSGNVFKTISTANVSLNSATAQLIKPPYGSRVEMGEYDFAVSGGAIGSFAIGQLLDNCSITRAWYEVITQPTSGDAATVGMGVVSDDATGIETPTAIASLTTGWHDADPDGTATNFTTKTTAIRNIILTIAAFDLTAGKIRVFWEYIQGA